jgi:predicted protein tyrosine phosphatase
MTKLYCQNISYEQAKYGTYSDVFKSNTMYIQIVDHESYSFTPKYEFEVIDYFVFKDAESKHRKGAVTSNQITNIANLLRYANRNSLNVLVSCHAGLCRSGAVVEVLVSHFGYTALDDTRIPNLLVKTELLKELGAGISSSTSMFN